MWHTQLCGTQSGGCHSFVWHAGIQFCRHYFGKVCLHYVGVLMCTEFVSTWPVEPSTKKNSFINIATDSRQWGFC